MLIAWNPLIRVEPTIAFRIHWRARSWHSCGAHQDSVVIIVTQCPGHYILEIWNTWDEATQLEIEEA